MELRWRARVALVLMVLSTTYALESTGSVTEADAIRRFVELSPHARQVPLIIQSTDAAHRIGSRVANPEVTYQVEDAAGTRDEFLTLRQELPITGRRRLMVGKAQAAASAAGFAAERSLQSEVYELKRSFYEVLYRELAVESLRAGSVELEQSVEVLRVRERTGEGSGYDVLRAEQELADLQIEVVEAYAALSLARSRFGSFYESDLAMSEARLEGHLSPTDSVPEIDEAVAEALEQRLDLRSLAARRERLDLERKAARRRRFPEPVVSAGWKRTDTMGLSDTGYTAALSIPLPIFDRGQLEVVRAQSAGQHVDLEREILTRQIKAAVQAAVIRERSARKVAVSSGEGAERRARELTEIAQLRYDEGESGILELLDAQRLSLAIGLRALAARYEVKRAEIDREHIIGNEVRP
jgi:cobalt-zinc-cadmium efflux system outer membrane protein